MANAYSKLIRESVKAELNLEGFTKDEQAEILDMLEENIIMRIHIDILNALSKEKRDQFFEVSEKSEPEKIEAFLRKELPDFEGIIKNAAVTTARELKNEQ
jgi:hypothetical protein